MDGAQGDLVKLKGKMASLEIDTQVNSGIDMCPCSALTALSILLDI